EGLGRDDETLGRFDDGGRRRAGLAVQDRHLANELTRAEHSQRLLTCADSFADANGASLDDEHFVTRLALFEKNVASLVLATKTGEELVLHGEQPLSLQGCRRAGQRAGAFLPSGSGLVHIEVAAHTTHAAHAHTTHATHATHAAHTTHAASAPWKRLFLL